MEYIPWSAYAAKPRFQGPFPSRKKEGLWERVECYVTNFLQKLAGSENFAEAEFRQITEVLLP